MSTLRKLPLCCTHFLWIVFKQPKCKDFCSPKHCWTVTSIAPVLWPSVWMKEWEYKCRQRGGDDREVSLGHDPRREAHASLGATVFIWSKRIQLNNTMPSFSQCIAIRQIKNPIYVDLFYYYKYCIRKAKVKELEVSAKKKNWRKKIDKNTNRMYHS